MGAKTAGYLISLGGFEIRNEHVPNLNISWTEKGALWFHKNMLLRLQILFRWTFRTPILKTMYNWWVCGARIYYNPVKVMHTIWLFLTISTGWVYVEDNPSKVMHTIWASIWRSFCQSLIRSRLALLGNQPVIVNFTFCLQLPSEIHFYKSFHWFFN